MEADKILRHYFIENRSRLIDIAAYLDRIGRSNNFDQVKDDFRWIAFKKSLYILLSEDQNRTLIHIFTWFRALRTTMRNWRYPAVLAQADAGIGIKNGVNALGSVSEF